MGARKSKEGGERYSWQHHPHHHHHSLALPLRPRAERGAAITRHRRSQVFGSNVTSFLLRQSGPRSSTSAGWRRIISDKESTFRENGHPLSQDVVDEGSIRTVFSHFCVDNSIHGYQGLLPKLRYGAINTFANAVDTTFGFEPGSGMVTFAARIIYRACQTGLNTKLQPQLVFEILADLHEAFPTGASNKIPCFPDEEHVQEQLQNIFCNYIDATHVVATYFVAVRLGNEDDYLHTLRQMLVTYKIKFDSYFQLLETVVVTAQRNRARIAESSHQRMSSGHNTTPFSSGRSLGQSHAQFEWVPMRLLGSGSYGKVEAVRNSKSPDQGLIARKTVSLINNNGMDPEELRQRVKKEAEIMQKLNHDNIVRVLFMWEEEGSCSILMQTVADFDLRDFLNKCVVQRYQPALLDHMRLWYGCLLEALAYAHKKGIMHRDIKPSNILIKKETGINGREVYNVLLADFGVAKDFTGASTSQSSISYEIGTPEYRAPEVTPQVPRGKKADIFSLGCVFSEMLTVQSYKSLEQYREHRQIQDSSGEIGSAFRRNLQGVNEWIRQRKVNLGSKERQLANHVLTMLQSDAEDRPTASHLIEVIKLHDKQNKEDYFFSPSS